MENTRQLELLDDVEHAIQVESWEHPNLEADAEREGYMDANPAGV
jgi:hypothetical protein